MYHCHNDSVFKSGVLVGVLGSDHDKQLTTQA